MPVSGEIYVQQLNAPCRRTPSGGLQCVPARSYSAVADAEGRFETEVLVPDDYSLRFSADPGLLGSNWWGGLAVSVRDGKSVRDLVITVSRAATLIVRVNDPLELLPAQGTQVWGNRLIVGVGNTTGAFWAATTGPRDTFGGFDYRLTIPYGLPLILWVFTRDFRVTDESGNALNTEGPNTVFTVPPFTCTKRFLLNVSPRAAAR